MCYLVFPPVGVISQINPSAAQLLRNAHVAVLHLRVKCSDCVRHFHHTAISRAPKKGPYRCHI